MKLYGLYNIKDYEQCEYFGTIKEIAEYLKIEPNSLRINLIRKRHGKNFLIKHKYELVKMEDTDVK